VASTITDITEWKAAEEELLRARERYATLCDNVSDFISIHDTKGVYLFASFASMELLGYTPEELIKINIFGQIHPEDSALFSDTYRKLVGMGANCNMKYRIKRKSDEYIWLETYARAVTGAHAGDVEILCISHKVRERRNMQAEAHYKGEGLGVKGEGRGHTLSPNSSLIAPMRDELTSLLNRRAIDELLNFKLASPRASNYPFGCLILDIDHFDTINTTHGRAVGDAVLQKMGQLLVESCRGEDFVARYQEDEFVIVLPNTDAAGTVLVAERIVDTVRTSDFGSSFLDFGMHPTPRSKIQNPKSKIALTVSIGGTCIRRLSDLTLSELIEIINSQLDEAKAMGRDRFVMNARETARQIERKT
jgi:diguanylate cyclase (GGDEF)-like protein/PAS domain S-box-containing protein